MEDEFKVPLNKSGFVRALSALRAEHDSAKKSTGSYKSEQSVRCFDCMFTTSSKDCYRCTYCTACSDCAECTHCSDCSNTYASSYCVSSDHCTKSSYLIMSSHCHESVFCFGCVGLVKKEFHILNRPFKKDEYFKLIKQLTPLFPNLKG